MSNHFLDNLDNSTASLSVKRHHTGRRLPLVTTLLVSLSAATISILSGCASTPSAESRLAYQQTQQSLASQPVAVISDGCLLRVEMGKDDILYQQSDLVSVSMAQTVKSRLMEKGVTVKHTSSPFVCGALTKEELTKLDILTTADAKDVPNTRYPLLSSSNRLDASTNQAYLNLFSAIDKAKKLADNSKGEKTPLGLDATSLASVRSTEGTNKVFVAMVSGSKPSFGASMAVGVATAVASGGTYVSTLQKGQHYAVYLVDLQNNQIEWSKSGTVKGEVFKMPVSDRFEQPELLKPLYND